jgi:type I restriction enzyme M protein
VDRDSGIDFDKEMKRIQQDFKAILADEVESQMALRNAFKGLGYEI